MVVVIIAVVTVLAWGSWIGLADSARSATVAGRTLRATIGNAGLAAAVAVALVVTGDPLIRPGDLALPFAGGLVWAGGNYCAFRSTAGLGIARAAGIWTGVNILTALAWGAFAFHEFADITVAGAVRLVSALAAVLCGLLLILTHTGSDPAHSRTDALPPSSAVGDATTAGEPEARQPVRGTTTMAAPADPTQQRSASSATANVGVHKGHRSWPGTAVAAALGAGVLWGSYFIPIQAADVAPAAANLPLAAGMVAGALVLAALTDGRLARLCTSREEILVVGAGVLWGVGNLGMLLLVDRIGAGRGFAIAQLGLIVNALIGIVAFQNPRPGSRAATVTLCGVVLAAIGGVLVGLSQ